MTVTHSLPRAEPLAFDVLTAAAVALFGVTAVWAVVDPRLIAAAPVWAKPAKFALSFTVHFATLAVIVRAMSPGARDARGVRVAALIMSAAFAGEVDYMIFFKPRKRSRHISMTPRHFMLRCIPPWAWARWR